MKVIKGMNRDMTCRGYKYEEGGTYKEDDAKLCERGFHGVTRPLDVFNYYMPGQSVYHEAELEDVTTEKSDDSKVCGKKITIGARLSIRNLVDAQIAYTREHCTNAYNAEPGKPATAGYGGAATAGNHGAATAGNCGAATSRGNASVGDYGIASVRGNGCMVRGGKGAVLVIAEERGCSYDIIAWKAVVVDGEKIKENTWYRLDGGELVEVEDDT